MPVVRRLTRLFTNLFRKDSVDEQLTRELESHVSLLADEKIATGLAPHEARRAALLELGGLEQVKEEVRAIRVGTALERVANDVRFSLRLLRKNAGFTATAVLTLALGIGGTTAIFSVVYSVLLRPLSVQEPDRIVTVWNVWRGHNLGAMSAGDFADIQRDLRSVEVMAAVQTASFTLESPEAAERVV